MLPLLTFTVLLLIVMPILIYGVGYAAKQFTRKLPRWISFPVERKQAKRAVKVNW